MKFLVYLDSRNSTGPRASSCRFELNQPIVNGSQVRVVSFVFANTLFNVTSDNNTLIFSSFTMTIPVGRYSATQLVDYINTTCNATPAFTTGHAVPPDPVPLTIVAGQVSWKIGDNVLQPCSALTIFCVSGYFTGNFSTNIFLANPWALSLHSPSLVGTTRFVCANPNRITAPFYVHQIQSAFGDVESSESSIALQYSTPLSHANLQQLDVLVLDPFSNRELVELSSWSCLLEVLV